MFKAIGNFLHRTPWWAMILGGLASMLLLGLFAVPVHVIRLADSGSSPEMNRAIKREIDAAFGENALGFAASIVSAIRENAKDPIRQAELDLALEEIKRARDEIFNATRDSRRTAKEARRAAKEAASQAQVDAAEATYEAAKEGREAIEEAHHNAIEALKESKISDPAVFKGFDESLKAARDAEAVAKKALEQAKRAFKDSRNSSDAKADAAAQDIKESVDSISQSRPTPPPAPTAPNKPSTLPPPPSGSEKGGITIRTELEDVPPSPPLSPETRQEIRSTVARDVRHIGIGSALILLFIPLFVVAVIAKFFIGRARRAQDFAEAKKQEAEFHSANRQLVEARLQALQAQVEPHFLYNTLANVQALTEIDPPAANKMVGHLIQYLRAALPKMREATSTIGQEVELVRAYLNILKMRMGERLDFAIDVPADCLKVPFPPLMLPSLVENAIKHGLEPVREGGHIEVSVQKVGGVIQVLVKDTGRGLEAAGNSSETGGGVGLSNIRERLQALYGDQGKLSLTSNVPKGVVAMIEVPTEPSIHFSSAAADAQSAPTSSPQPKHLAGRIWQVVTKVHGTWARILVSLFMVSLLVLMVMFGLSLAGMATGWLPLEIEGTKLGGVEGMAIGTVIMTAVFSVLVFVALLLMLLAYGLSVLFACLAFIIPAVALAVLFPPLAPLVLLGFVIYLLWRRRQRLLAEGRAKKTQTHSDSP